MIKEQVAAGTNSFYPMGGFLINHKTDEIPGFLSRTPKPLDRRARFTDISPRKGRKGRLFSYSSDRFPKRTPRTPFALELRDPWSKDRETRSY